MKVDCINKNHITFTAGKVNVFSDFDGTYFPVWQPDLREISSERVEKLNTDFKEFDSFTKNLKSDLDFKITTGRTFGEFKTMAELIKSKGIVMPFADSLITKNGSDEFVRIAKDEDFYSKGIYPYDYYVTNTAKDKNIETLTGWNKNIKNKLIQILNKYKLNIAEHDSEYPSKDHGQGSLFSSVNYDNFELQNDMQPKSAWTVGLRRDGNLKLYISFPYDMLHVKERKEAYSKIQSEFEQYLNQSGVKFAKEEFLDKVAGNRPTLTYMPKIESAALTKLYDTKLALKNAVINNDLVITAGDGINDLEMLNPLNYLEGSRDISNPETIKELKRLPFIGIVIKGENSGLEGLYKTFGQYGKIIEIEKSKLTEGIKQAIKLHSQNNEIFLQNLSNELKSQIGIVSEQSAVSAQKSSNKGTKIITLITSLTAGLSGILYLLKNNKAKEGQDVNK